MRLQQLLSKLRTQTARATAGEAGDGSRWDHIILHPDGRFRSAFDVVLVCLLLYTCVVVPLRIAFHSLFDSDSAINGWDVVDVFIEWIFILSVVLNFFTGYFKDDGQLVMNLSLIAKRYLRGWFWVDAISSVPVDTVGLLAGSSNPVLRLNKVLRVARLYKVLTTLRRSKWTQRRIDPAAMKLCELLVFLALAWHYMGCLWWYVSDANDRPLAERLRVLDVSLESEDDPRYANDKMHDVGLQYLASIYWAVMMTTGLNVAIGPGMREGQILYECLIAFFGVCLQAYMLGATATELANMDAQDTARRQRLNAIKQHLRSLRVPTFLRVQIMEYYERQTTMNESQELDAIRDMPSSLKVQLAVSRNAEFLSSVSFFANLDGTVSAALVLCMSSRICLPGETIIHQGDVSTELYFIRSGTCEVVQYTGASADTGASEPAHDEGGTEKVVAMLRDHSCFGEQSFITQQPTLATVRSVGYCTLMRIFKRDFDIVCEMFPALRVHVLSVQRHQLSAYASASMTKRARSSSMWGSGISTVVRSSQRCMRRSRDRFTSAKAVVAPLEDGPAAPATASEQRWSRSSGASGQSGQSETGADTSGSATVPLPSTVGEDSADVLHPDGAGDEASGASPSDEDDE